MEFAKDASTHPARKSRMEWPLHAEEGIAKKSVKLKKHGNEYIGCCPFHNEKTPSFYVSPIKKIFHCFGCGESGDVLSFIMKHDHLSFKEVIIQKAHECNIEIDSFKKESNRYDHIDKIRKTLTLLQDNYASAIKTCESAQLYCKERHLTQSDILEFGIGYASDHPTQSKWIKVEQLSSNELTATGLFNNDLYPLLNHRLIFPIHNSQGIIVGFSGRTLSQETKAKYINSPESVVFSKKKLLYISHIRNMVL